MTCHTQPSKDDLFRARREQAKRRFYIIQGGQSDLEYTLDCNLPEQARRTDSLPRSVRAGGSPNSPSESRPLFSNATDLTTPDLADWLAFAATIFLVAVLFAIYVTSS